MGRIKYEPVAQLKQTLGDLGRDLSKIPNALKDWKYILKYLLLAALINLLFYFIYSITKYYGINIPIINPLTLLVLWGVSDYLLVAFFLNGKKLYCPLIVWIDLGFLTIFGFIYKLYFDRIMVHATNIMQQSGSMATALQTQDIYSAAPIAQTLSSELVQIEKLAALLALSILVIWIVFQSINWFVSFRISGRKISYMQYLKSFALTSVLWGALISVILYISISTFFANAMTLSGGVTPTTTILDIGLIIASVVIGYFAVVSYSLHGKIKDVFRKTVMFSLLKSRVFVSYLLVIIIAIILNFIIFGLWKLFIGISEIPAIIVGAILLMVFFVFARIYMINVVQSLDKKN